jgi:hypothetical protein
LSLREGWALPAGSADASGIQTGCRTAWVSRNRSADARLTNGSWLEGHDVAGNALATPCRRQRTALIDHTVALVGRLEAILVREREGQLGKEGGEFLCTPAHDRADERNPWTVAPGSARPAVAPAFLCASASSALTAARVVADPVQANI